MFSKDKFEGFITVYQENGIFHFYLFRKQTTAMELPLGYTISGKIVIDYSIGTVRLFGNKILEKGKPLASRGAFTSNTYKVNFVVHNG